MAFEYWMDELELLRESTRRRYLYYFNIFLEAVGVDAEELYQWQRRLSLDGDPRTDREIVRLFVKDYRGRVGWGPGTVHNYAYAVRSFFSANNLVFPLRTRDLPKKNASGARVILLDEIREIWDYVGNEFKLRNRALLMTLKDSGLRRSDVCRLNVEDYLGAKVIETENGVFRVFEAFVTLKTGAVAYIHLGPESVGLIDRYLGDRVKGPLFLGRENKRLTAGALGMLLDRLAGLMENGDSISPHSFRKTHRTLLEAHIPESYVKKLQGKATDPYIHPEQTGELTEAYIKHYDALRVFREAQELEEMRRRAEDTEGTLDDVTREMRDMKHEIERLKMKNAVREAVERQQKI